MAQDPGNDDVRLVWDELAGYWDAKTEAGATWQRILIQPAVERALGLARGERVLELACGNGEFARRLTELGASVLATDFSEAMLAAARSHGGDIEYRRVDATDPEALRALAVEAPFDAVVSNMAAMDMLTLEPMASATGALLGVGGRLVVSTLHPAFNSGEVIRFTEETEGSDGRVVRTRGIKRTSYIRPLTSKGTGLEDQPVTQWYFHRSLQDLVRPFYDHGWVVDGLSEPVLPPGEGAPFDEIPGVLVLRFTRRT